LDGNNIVERVEPTGTNCAWDGAWSELPHLECTAKSPDLAFCALLALRSIDNSKGCCDYD
jgi:hypothetical protein